MHSGRTMDVRYPPTWTMIIRPHKGGAGPTAGSARRSGLWRPLVSGQLDAGAVDDYGWSTFSPSHAGVEYGATYDLPRILVTLGRWASMRADVPHGFRSSY